MSQNSTPGVPGQVTDPSTRIISDSDLSHLAIRDDGRVMLSLEDCQDRDLTGREVVTFVLLTPEETERARIRALDGLLYVAARTANELPKAAKS